MQTFNRVLKNIMSAGQTRQNSAKKRSLCVTNEHVESNFNTVWPNGIGFQNPVNAIKEVLTALAVALLLLSATGSASAQETPLPLYGQVMVAAFSVDDTDDNLEGDSFDLTLFGVAAQKPLLADMPVDLGFETGALLSWKNDTRFAQISSGPSGGTIRVEIENQMLLVDYFFGGYAGFRPIRWLRLFAGAGPLLVYGYRVIEPEAYDGTAPEKTYESKLAVGAYARCGAEIVFSERCMLGAGVRAITSGLEFNESIGDIRYEGIQYFLSFSFSL